MNGGEAEEETPDWRDLDWSDLQEGEPVAWRDIHPETPEEVLEVDGRRFVPIDSYCIVPGCDCGEASVVFEEEVPGSPERGLFGAVWVEVESGERVGLRHPPREGDRLDRLWAAYRARHPPAEMQARDEEIARIAPEIHALWEEQQPVETVRRAEPKVGRNDPCPCGSGRKHKKCCGA